MPLFKKLLYRPGEADAMWRHLERLMTDEGFAQDFALRHLARCQTLLSS